jgi:hypothetical protein
VFIRTRDHFSVIVPDAGLEIPFLTTTEGRFLQSQVVVETKSLPVSKQVAAPARRGLELWHNRLGHVSKDTITKTVKAGAVSGVSLEKDKPEQVDCDSCVEGKSTIKRRHRSTYDEAGKPGDEIASDVCGPLTPPAIASGARYMIGYIDRKSRCLTVMFAKRKSEQVDCFKAFWAVSRSFGVWIKLIKTDGGSEYRNKEMQAAWSSPSIFVHRGV